MKKHRKKIGLPPGSVVFTGSKKVEQIFVHYLQYDANDLTEKTFDNHEQIIVDDSPDEKVDWYDMRGLHDTQLIEFLGQKFKIHPLILEDIADIHQRPKFEEYDNGNFIIFKALRFDKENLKIQTEHVALYFCKGLIFTFQETASDLFSQIRQRIQNSHGRVRKRGADYLAYTLLDVIADQYFVVLEDVETVIEKLEDDLLHQPDNSIKERIHHLKKELLIVRKSIAPLREAVSRFVKSESNFIEDNTTLFIQDLYDHLIQIIDMVETYRDVLNGLQDLYLSEISFRMNQVMQVLTIITTIFVPLSFLAGLYGMNFEYIPELGFKYGYFVLLGVMILVGGGLLIWFKRRRWL